MIAGSAGRRKIEVPKSVARPTTDRTREALFSILHEIVQGAKCLDLFAGSGALGLEALSRGAASCDFVDGDRGAIQTIKKNLKQLSLAGAQVRQGDVMSFVRNCQSVYDVVFADPPYVKSASDTDFIAELFVEENFSECFVEGAYFVAESPAGRIYAAPSGWQIVAERSYGSCGITIYQKG